MSAPFSNSDALRDGWGFDTAEDEVRAERLEQEDVEICVEQVEPKVRRRYAEVGEAA